MDTHRTQIAEIPIPANGALKDRLEGLGIGYEHFSYDNLLNAKFPEGWMRICGPNGEWLFPTKLEGPDGTEIIISYEERLTQIVPPLQNKPE